MKKENAQLAGCIYIICNAKEIPKTRMNFFRNTFESGFNNFTNIFLQIIAGNIHVNRQLKNNGLPAPNKKPEIWMVIQIWLMSFNHKLTNLWFP